MTVEIGPVHLGLGNNQLALDWWEKTADERRAHIIHLKSDPICMRIRGEPWYRALLKRMGLDH